MYSAGVSLRRSVGVSLRRNLRRCLERNVERLLLTLVQPEHSLLRREALFSHPDSFVTRR